MFTIDNTKSNLSVLTAEQKVSVSNSQCNRSGLQFESHETVQSLLRTQSYLSRDECVVYIVYRLYRSSNVHLAHVHTIHVDC